MSSFLDISRLLTPNDSRIIFKRSVKLLIALTSLKFEHHCTNFQKVCAMTLTLHFIKFFILKPAHLPEKKFERGNIDRFYG